MAGRSRTRHEMKEELESLEKRHLFGFFMHAPVPFAVWRMDGELLTTNQAFKDLFGRDEPPPQDRFQRAIDGETVQVPTFGLEGRTPPVAVSMTMFPLRSEAGEVEFVGATYKVDIELDRSAARLKVLVESSREFALAVNDAQKLLEVVARSLSDHVGELCTIRLVANAGSGALSRPVMYHPDPKKLESVDVDLAQRAGEGISGRVLATGEPILIPRLSAVQIETEEAPRFRALVESLAITSMLIVPLKCRDRILGVINMSRSDPAPSYNQDDLLLAMDLADRAALVIENALLVKELEQRAAKRTASLEEARHELEAFAYSIAHDLLAPLRAISGFSGTLLEDHGSTLDPSVRANVERVMETAARMGRIIDALLSLARVTRTEIRRETVDLSALARDVVASLRSKEPARSVEVSIADGMRAEGDRDLLRTVLENLLGNAWKFTKNTSRAQIDVGLEARADGIRYFISDNGAGFNMEYADKLFTPFGRLHNVREFEGTGIGLATVQRIIRRHGGRVWGTGKENAGAKFEFTLVEPTEESAWIAAG